MYPSLPQFSASILRIKKSQMSDYKQSDFNFYEKKQKSFDFTWMSETHLKSWV